MFLLAPERTEPISKKQSTDDPPRQPNAHKIICSVSATTKTETKTNNGRLPASCTTNPIANGQNSSKRSSGVRSDRATSPPGQLLPVIRAADGAAVAQAASQLLSVASQSIDRQQTPSGGCHVTVVIIVVASDRKELARFGDCLTVYLASSLFLSTILHLACVARRGCRWM